MNIDKAVRKAEKQICDALWKTKSVRGDSEWPNLKLQQIIREWATAKEQAQNRGYDA